MTENDNCSRTWCTLRIHGASVDPVAITRLLGIAPSEAHHAGEIRYRDKRWKQGYWGLSSEGHVDSTDLAEHIDWLLAQIEPQTAGIHQLIASGHTIDVFCFWESLTGQGGPSFPPSLLHRLAALQLSLGLDIYFAS